MAEKVIFILGGARSGKSLYAQQRAQKMGSHVLYIATARVQDDEMERRVAAHRAARPSGWQTLKLQITCIPACKTCQHIMMPSSSIALPCCWAGLLPLFQKIPVRRHSPDLQKP